MPTDREVELERLLRRRDLAAARRHLETIAPQPLLQAMRSLARGQRATAFALVDDRSAHTVFQGLASGSQADLVSRLAFGRAKDLFGGLDPDDQARLLDRLPATLADRLLATLPEGLRATTLRLVGYPPKSAGRAMNTAVVSVHAAQSVATALDHVRAVGAAAETVYMLPVCDADDTVVGVVSLRRLLFSRPDSPVREVMSSPAITVSASQDQEEAAKLVRTARLIAAPVVDSSGHLLGVLTVDDAMRILEEADDEDFARGAGSRSLPGSYRAVTVLDLVRARIGWLLVLILAATLTVNVLDYFESTLAQVVTLALFVPLLIGTGGNAGAQSATTVVRAMAVGEVHRRHLHWVVLREVATGAVLGVALALVAVVPVALFAGGSLAAVVALSLVVICVLATAVGAVTPQLAQRAGVDPAVVSAPLISTLVDASGLVVYFLIARAVLGL